MKTRSLLPSDWDRIKVVYKKGIASGHATFQLAAPSWEEWHAGHLLSCRLVAEADEIVIGWAALSAVSRRQVYSGVAEVSIYIDPEHSGKGVGYALLKELVAASETNGLWTLQAGIFPENTASLRIHRKAGFRILCTREKIGKHHGRWRDTVLLERRSKQVL